MGCFSDLPIGSMVYIGMSDKVGNPFVSDPAQLCWLKVSDQGDLIMVSDIGWSYFDSKEPENPSRDRRSRGGNFFPESNLFQYLNSYTKAWYVPAHEYDACPKYYNPEEPGFMSVFSPFERTLLETREITCVVPAGFKKKYGKEVKIRCKVSLPSLSELGHGGDNIPEGDPFPNAHDLQARGTFWTRTAVGSGVAIYKARHDRVEMQSACYTSYLAPMIRLRPDVQIEDEPDDLDVYYIENTPAGMSLESILGF